MAVRRTMVRLGVVIVGLSALGVALPTLASSQHKAGPSQHQAGKHQAGERKAGERKAGLQKCCDVRLRDAFGTVTSVGEPASVTATVAATRNGCTNVHPRITVSLAGLDPDEIRIERVVRGTPLSLAVRPAGDGAVRAADPVRDGVRLCGNGRANLAYRLTFLAGAPAGAATVSAEADNGGGRVLGQDRTVTVVRGPAATGAARGRAAPPPSTVPPAGPSTAPATAPSAGASSTGDRGAGAPGSGADSPSATQRGGAAGPAQLSSTLVAAGLGALVAATIGLVGVLALRHRGRRKDPATGSTDPAGPAGSPGHLGSQPTLAARWSSLVRSVRRPSTPASEQS